MTRSSGHRIDIRRFAAVGLPRPAARAHADGRSRHPRAGRADPTRARARRGRGAVGGGAAIEGYHLNRDTQDMTCGARVLKVAFVVRMYKSRAVRSRTVRRPRRPTSRCPARSTWPGMTRAWRSRARTPAPTARRSSVRIRARPGGRSTRRPRRHRSASSATSRGPTRWTPSIVGDSGSQIYGSDACGQLTAEGWKRRPRRAARRQAAAGRERATREPPANAGGPGPGAGRPYAARASGWHAGPSAYADRTCSSTDIRAHCTRCGD